MKRQMGVAISILSVAVTCSGMTAQAQTRAGAQDKIRLPGPEALASLPVPEETISPFRVLAHPSAKGDQKALIEKYAPIASRIRIVPEPRLARFAWINDPTRYRFRTWSGTLEGVEIVPGGAVVTIRVRPEIDSNRGAATVVRGSVIEKYRIIGNTAELVEFIDLGPNDHSIYTF